MRRLIPAALLLAPLAAAAEPVAVRPCNETAGAWNLVEPWDRNAALYAEGRVRVALLDTAEPAAAPVHLLVISPPRDELGLPQCRIVSLSRDGSGFYGIHFAARRASYAPGRGLTLTLPAKRFVPETGDGAPATLTVTIDQQTGAISADLS